MNSGKTLYTLEKRYGNDGYAFLFKVLEALGKSENHFIDCRNPADWEFLLAITNVSEVIAEEMMKLLTTLGTFDEELWSSRIIFSANFIENLKNVYERRKRKCMQKSDICEQLQLKCSPKPDSSEISGAENTQSKVKRSEVKESKADIFAQKDFAREDNQKMTQADFKEFWDSYPKKRSKQKAQEKFLKIPREFLPKILRAVREQKESHEWQKDGGQFIPHPTTWLNGKRWEDDINSYNFNDSNHGKNQRDRLSGYVSKEGYADLVIGDDDL
ncbi:DUF4373 domain-containing protein [Candidatus Peregrinibacteria bacterium]|nr:MAG: DUF4373 domain-containing protein [Candidatus Peregrinibacteria bacterium]